MTSSTKPEIRNISLPEEDRATAIGSKRQKFDEARTCRSEDVIADRQTYRQTDTLITILRSRFGGAVMTDERDFLLVVYTFW